MSSRITKSEWNQIRQSKTATGRRLADVAAAALVRAERADAGETDQDAARAISEHQHQCEVIAWCATEGAHLPGIERLHAIPNGGARPKATAGNLQREGVRAGIPDIFLPHAERGYHALYVEIKKVGGKLRGPQRAFLRGVAAEGFCAVSCEGANAAIATIEWYYGLRETLPSKAKLMEAADEQTKL